MRVSLFTIMLLLYAHPALAVLGGAPTEFGVRGSARKAQALVVLTRQNYRVNESMLVSGTLVREYVASSGVVFAVSWHGPFLPDLHTLLGAHFNTMVTEAHKIPRAGHSQLRVARPEVNIVSGGHLRAFEGRAWMFSGFPPGFNLDDIQ
ncbi:DUF2844 domain-containing protein [soil metagenome]